MCPFMPKALACNDVHFAFFDSRCSDRDLQNIIKSCVDFYVSRRAGSFGAVVILFEADFDVLRLLRAHIDAKPYCIKNGLMLGALYEDSPAPSLHSQEYYPLRTPVPILVLRDLTVQDLQFLNPDHYGVLAKIKFLNAFVRKFSSSPMKSYARNQIDEAKRLRTNYRLLLGGRLASVLLVAGIFIALGRWWLA
ncbi:hypothetical protein PpSQ1_02090 [Pseudomonas putida]|nr:hypothetical protein PpSQ1_02090 [Pseudomonas putida]